jgi:chaperone modulatory protein CbpM
MNPKNPNRPIEPSDPPTLDLEALCVVLEVRQERVCEWVDEGLLRPRRRSAARSEWRFPADQCERARRALRLQRELELETNALPLVMDLLGEVQRLRRRVRLLEDRFLEDRFFE